MTLLGEGDDCALLLCCSVHRCCVNWCYASPGLSLRWCLVCEVCRLTVDWVDCRCFLSFVFLGGAMRGAPCNTPVLRVTHQ